MKDRILTVKENTRIAKDLYKMVMEGPGSDVSAPGQFVNLKIEGLYLRRPISVCDADASSITIIYKVVGRGTELMSAMGEGTKLDVLTDLGNGFDVSLCGDSPLLIGGGIGSAPLYMLAKELNKKGIRPAAVLGFASAEDVFFENEFKELCSSVTVVTNDGSYGEKGFVTEHLPRGCSFFYACGPEPMLKAVHKATDCSGQLSFEKRMGCGFGACMGCSCETITGYKRICKEGPVLMKEEILWT